MRSRWRQTALLGASGLMVVGVVVWFFWPTAGGSSPEPQRTEVREGELEVLSVPRAIQSLDWSPDGTSLAVVTKPDSPENAREQKHAVQIWDAKEGKLLRTLVETANPVTAVRFAPDGETVAIGVWRFTGFTAGNNQSEVELWEPETGRLRAKLAGANSDILAIAFSRDGRFLAAGGKVTSGPPVTARHISGEVILWDVGTGKMLWQQTRGHTDSVQAVAFSPDGTILASAGDDKVIRLWDTASGKLNDVWFGHGKPSVASVVFSPDGTRLVSGGGDSTVHWWDAKTGKIERITTASYAVGPLLCVDVSPDGTMVAAGGTVDEGGGQRKGRAVVWDAKTGAVRHRLAEEMSFVRDLRFSPDGRTLAIATWDGKVYLWRPQDQGSNK